MFIATISVHVVASLVDSVVNRDLVMSVVNAALVALWGRNVFQEIVVFVPIYRRFAGSYQRIESVSAYHALVEAVRSSRVMVTYRVLLLLLIPLWVLSLGLNLANGSSVLVSATGLLAFASMTASAYSKCVYPKPPSSVTREERETDLVPEGV